jgi:hypothetical protein
MRDVDSRIAAWRRALAETGTCSPDAIDELETHVREEYDRLVRSGELPDRALEAAFTRVGAPQTLAAEFGKIAAGRPWMPARGALVLFAVAAAVVPIWLAYRYHDRRLGLLLAAHVASVTLGFGAALILGGVAACYVLRRLFHDLSSDQEQSLVRAARRLTRWATLLTGAAIVLGMAWMGAKGEAVWSWDPRESGAALVLVWCVTALTFSGQRVEARTEMLAALVGSAVVVTGWFGPHVVLSRLDAVPIVAAALLPLVLFAVGLAPPECLQRRNA